MEMLMNVFKDKTVNSLTTAVVVGSGFFAFALYLGNQISGLIFEEGYSWEWDAFFSQVIILVVAFLTGAWIHSQSK